MNEEQQISNPFHQSEDAQLSPNVPQFDCFLESNRPQAYVTRLAKKGKRQCYNKTEQILYDDPLNGYIKPIMHCFKMLESRVQATIQKPLDKIFRGCSIKGMSVTKGEKVFGKMICGQFLMKFRRIVRYLQSNQSEQIFTSCNNQQALKWLIKLLREETDKQKFLQKKSDKFLRKMYQALLNMMKKPELKHSGYQGIKKWFQIFIRQNRIFPEKMAKDSTLMMHQEIKQNNSQRVIDIVQLRPKVKTLQKRTEQLVKLEYNNLKEGKRKLSLDSHRNKQVLRINKPKCPSRSCRSQLESRKCNNGDHSIVICDKCGWNQHECPQQYQEIQFQGYYEDFNLVSKGQRIKQFELFELKPVDSQNNIIETLQNLSYNYITKSPILSSTPRAFICHYPILPEKACSQIFRNRQQEHFLPLTIKQSSIQGAGLGVFATQNIPKVGTLVCSYLGEIGLGKFVSLMRQSHEVINQNDSLYTLGWLEKEDLLMIAPNKFCNVGRFINYNVASKCNLKPSICLLEPEKDRYEISVLLTTTREISAGQQLFYNYGQDYAIEQ